MKTSIQQTAAKLGQIIRTKELVEWFMSRGIETDDVKYYRVATRLIEISRGE